jgi:CRISPR-associated exonuclease Cas4
LASGTLPPPTQDERRCRGCSLRDRCQPQAVDKLRNADPAATLFDPDAL